MQVGVGGDGSQREWEAPTWVLACVARRPHGGFGKSRLSKGGRSRQMLGFLDAGPLSFPLLVSQRESHREDLEGRDGQTRKGGAVILGCRQKKRKAYCRELRQSDWITLE